MFDYLFVRFKIICCARCRAEKFLLPGLARDEDVIKVSQNHNFRHDLNLKLHTPWNVDIYQK